MEYRFCLVDAFVTAQSFSGNPASVVFLEGAGDWPEEAWMQGLGMEFNQAETAFLLPREAGRFGLRWFTPAAEVDLCGHATMASARGLVLEGFLGDGERVVFETKSGELFCRVQGEDVEMDFPEVRFEVCENPGLDVEGAVGWYSNGMDWLVEVGSEEAVRAFEPDMGAISGLGLRGLVVSSVGREFDYVCRFFAPQYGVPEDPVTGSVHCCLGPIYARRTGVEEVRGYQASRRGGEVLVRTEGGRSVLSGRCRVVARGVLV